MIPSDEDYGARAERRLRDVRPTSLEVCAGAGGQALGLEQAGFDHVELVEWDPQACATLARNRPHWTVRQQDLLAFHAHHLKGRVDLVAGGVPCPPFSVAGKQLGSDDERDLFPAVLRLVQECEPNAVLVENVPGLLKSRFDGYRREVLRKLKALGYTGDWRLLNACDFGVPQLRPRAILVALRPELHDAFLWPAPSVLKPLTVGSALAHEMGSRGWPGASEWARSANRVAPTLVGGSRKHGGPDLGPTRARAAWQALGVEGRTLGELPPGPDHQGMPRLTVRMAAIVQGFPDEWEFVGRKTQAYRQVGNAFPPAVARAVGLEIKGALRAKGETNATRTEAWLTG